MEYRFENIEKKWKKYWKENQVYKTSNNTDKPKFYVLDMFPYPSGAGLHVGHPLGYIASDIYARYKKMKGFNVLHPMGFDAFGLPAEQYALETGQHPAVTTEKNIARYKEQLDNIGFCYDWDREVRTSDPNYYKWTQWIFLQLFHSWYDRKEQQAKPIVELIGIFEKEGNKNVVCPEDENLKFDAADWSTYDERQQREILMQYRLAFQGYAEVWWCEGLGTVLANDEVVNGVSERGGFPVERKRMRQWFLRITEYADRLIESLDKLEWSEAMKEMQRNWIGKSIGAEIKFQILNSNDQYPIANGQYPIANDQYPISNGQYPTANGQQPTANSQYPTANSQYQIDVFTTRPDTIFGVDFMVLAPEHELINEITTAGQKDEIAKYKDYVKSRSERERMAETKKITGAFTGAYVIHPFTQKQIPVWISEYVLAGYGTGAIMAVPSGDDRDFAFARHFNIPITNIFGEKFTNEAAVSDKNIIIENSDFINGMKPLEASEEILKRLEALGVGKRKINYKLRDAGFSRQRYWGEPFPIVYQNGLAYAIDEPQLNMDDNYRKLPVELPMVESYGPGAEGEGPLANVDDWKHLNSNSSALNTNTQYVTSSPAMEKGQGDEVIRETSTMPGYAGSSWYFLRYMDPGNKEAFASRKATDYWREVDLYIGGTEHAVGHLLYSRMWTKVLYDLGHIGFDEPFKKLVNQGMIQGSSRFVYGISFDLTVHVLHENDKNGKIAIERPLFLISSNLNNDIQSENVQQSVKNIIIQKLESIFDSSDYQIHNILTYPIHVDVNLVDGVELDIEAFKKWKNGEYANAEFILEDGSLYTPFSTREEGSGMRYICGTAIEKMSKSKYNVVNPDDIVAQYGADTFRMYEMFLGPIDVSKPWDTKGIEGVHRFLKKLWRLYFDEQKGWRVNDEKATEAELKTLHKTIKKIGEDIEDFSFNTSVSQFMICVNELGACHKKEILEPLVLCIAPFAPHVAEELWHRLGHETSIVHAAFPGYEEKYVVDNTKVYPVAVNGKTRLEMEFPLDATPEEVEKQVMANENLQKYLDGKTPKKFIFVKGRMINVVI